MSRRAAVEAITPPPTPEEAAAIAAAVTVLLQGPSDGGWTAEPEPPRWRFSGRWWSKPVPVRRDRPF